MSSFFEKLKKGMGVQEPIEEVLDEKPVKEKKQKQPRKPKVKKEKPEEGTIEEMVKEKPEEPKKIPEKKIKKIEAREEIKERPIEEQLMEEEKPKEKEEPVREPVRDRWLGEEGQLAIDVFQTEKELIIQAAIAGIKSEDLDISIEKDVISLKGVRPNTFLEKGDYFIQECFWGPFSREIILPVEIDPNSAQASMSEGIITIRLPKIVREKKRKITVK